MNAWSPETMLWIDALGRSLLHFLWQGALIGVGYFFARRFCRSINARYRLGMAMLLLMACCPALTLWLQVPAHIGADRAPAWSIASVDLATVALAPIIDENSALQFDSALTLLVAIWLGGVSLIATCSFLHWRRLARVIGSAIELPAPWQQRLARMQRRFGVKRQVRLLASAQILTPTLIGWLTPVILLPISLLSGFTPAQVELIIAHELSHVRRFDYVANLIQVAIETILFYHPVVHLISRDVRQARESCCDDLVLSVGDGNRMIYARTLADLQEMQHDFGASVPALGVGGGELFARIRRIVDPAHAVAIEPLPRGNAMTLPILLAFAAIALLALRIHAVPSALVQEMLQLPGRDIALLSGNASLQAINVASRPEIASPLVSAKVRWAMAPAAARDAQAHGHSEDIVANIPAAKIAAPVIGTADISAALGATAIEHARASIARVPASVIADLSNDVAVRATPSTHILTAADPQLSRIPVADRIVQPHYPELALMSRTTGVVHLDFEIGRSGEVRDARILHAQPAGVFDQVALAALRQWHFSSGGGSGQRYTRSFAFTRADPQIEAAVEGCHEITGSHICRHRDTDFDASK